MASSKLHILLVVATIATAVNADYPDHKAVPAHHDKPYYPPGPHCPDCTCNCPTVHIPDGAACNPTITCPPQSCTCPATDCGDNTNDCSPVVNVPPPECTCDCPATTVCDPVCACKLPLTFEQFLGAGCDTSLTCDGSTPGAVCIDNGCSGPNDPSQFCNSVPPPHYAFCDFTPQLCYRATCPREGSMHIKAEALTCCDGANSPTALAVSLNGEAAAGSNIVEDTSINHVFQCTGAQETYYVCEQTSVINTDSLSFTFFTAYPNGCPSTDYIELSCTTAPTECDVVPVRSTNGTQAAKPATPKKPVQAVKPSKAAKPVKAAQPAAPTKPVKAAQPAAPTKPVKAAQPAAPTKPVKAAQPAAPTKPVKK